MKICVIGNSHTSCFRRAWDSLSESYPEAVITFFVSFGGFFDQLEVDKKVSLRMTNPNIRKTFAQISGGNEKITLKNYDIVLIIGGFHRNTAGQMAALGGESKLGYSRQALKMAFEDLYSSTHAKGLIHKIREISDIPIYLVHNPFMAPKKTVPIVKLSHQFKNYNYEKGTELMNKIIFSPLGTELLIQPEETILKPFFSKCELAYGERPIRLANHDLARNGETWFDGEHLNTNYGKLRLEFIFEKLGVKPVLPTIESTAP